MPEILKMVLYMIFFNKNCLLAREKAIYLLFSEGISINKYFRKWASSLIAYETSNSKDFLRKDKATPSEA